MVYAQAISQRRQIAEFLFPKRWSSHGTDLFSRHRNTTTAPNGAAEGQRACLTRNDKPFPFAAALLEKTPQL